MLAGIAPVVAEAGEPRPARHLEQDRLGCGIAGQRGGVVAHVAVGQPQGDLAHGRAERVRGQPALRHRLRQQPHRCGGAAGLGLHLAQEEQRLGDEARLPLGPAQGQAGRGMAGRGGPVGLAQGHEGEHMVGRRAGGVRGVQGRQAGRGVGQGGGKIGAGHRQVCQPDARRGRGGGIAQLLGQRQGRVQLRGCVPVLAQEQVQPAQVELQLDRARPIPVGCRPGPGPGPAAPSTRGDSP